MKEVDPHISDSCPPPVPGGQPAALPADEEQRLAALRLYDVLDTLEEQDYDDLARLAAELTGRPLALMSLVDRDRQWFKAHHGLAARETPREMAFCAHAILTPDEPFLIPDSHSDPRFADNPLVVGAPVVRSYAGVPLREPRGKQPLGTLCVIDHKPGALTAEQLASLQVLARHAERLLELRLVNKELRSREQLLREQSEQLEQRNGAMRLLLDHVDEGFLSIDREGGLSDERSRVLERWFGPADTGISLWQYLASHSRQLRDHFEMAWLQVVDGWLPLQLALAQMPDRFEKGGRSYSVEYKPIGSEPARWKRMLVLVRDITAQLESARIQAEDRSIIEIFSRLMYDRRGAAEFVASASGLVAAMTSNPPPRQLEAKRLLHTLKGNCAAVGLEVLAQSCHELETRAEHRGGGLSDSEVSRLSREWERISRRLRALLGELEAESLFVDEEDFAELKEALRVGKNHGAIAQLVEAWRLEPTEIRLQRAAQQIQMLAEKLNKLPVRVDVRANRVRLDPDQWAELWQVFPHLLRNAVDHGLESVAQRRSAGKPDLATIALEAELTDSELVLSLRDSGRGIDWQGLAQRAERLGLSCRTRAELEAALFEDRLSTKAEVTEVSGRGVGLGAVKDVVQGLGGQISIESSPGLGCLVRMTWPASRARPNRSSEAPSGSVARSA